MSLRTAMQDAVRRGVARLPDAPRTLRFLTERLRPDGGFADRSGASDLYYSVFGAAALNAFGRPWPTDRFATFLARFGGSETLDLVHTAALARCWAELDWRGAAAGTAARLAERLRRFRRPDGGYTHASDGPDGTVYGAFLALGAWQDLGRLDEDEIAALRTAVEACRTPDGGYANAPQALCGSTSATAAALCCLVELGAPVDPLVPQWLLGLALPPGGFAAWPGWDVADLLSTATALHALARAGAPRDGVAAAAEAFIASLLDGASGGFRGHAADPDADVEHTFYALLALGSLP